MMLFLYRLTRQPGVTQSQVNFCLDGMFDWGVVTSMKRKKNGCGFGICVNSWSWVFLSKYALYCTVHFLYGLLCSFQAVKPNL